MILEINYLGSLYAICFIIRENKETAEDWMDSKEPGGAEEPEENSFSKLCVHSRVESS